MLINSSDNPENTNNTAQFISDVNTDDFEQSVIAASMERPVIVDFWAPWCGPCKQIVPVLEKIVCAANGHVALAKINIDQNQDLAAALRVQSVPTVFAFFQGRPVDAFQGAQPESKIREFVQKIITLANSAQPGALDIEDALKDAAGLLAQGDVQGAHQLYDAILQQDGLNVEAYVGMVRCFIEIAELERAQLLIDEAPEEISKLPAFSQALTALEVANSASGGEGNIEDFERRIKKDENDHQARIDLALAFFASGRKEDAANALLDSIALDGQWSEQAARKELLKLFEAMGYEDPVTLSARRRLSSLLFS